MFNLENANPNFHDDLWHIRMTEYLDGELPAKQVEGFENHLKDCEMCWQELKSLRLTVNALSQLSALTPKALRSFVLTEAQARKLRPRPIYRVILGGAVVAAALLFCMMALDVMGIFTTTTTQIVALSVPEGLPTFGTNPPLPCATPTEAGSVCGSAASGTVEVFQPTPPTTKVTTINKSGFVPLIQVALIGLTMTLLAFAIVSRPRAPGRKRN